MVSFQVVQETLNALTHKLGAQQHDARRFLDAVLVPLWSIAPSPGLAGRSPSRARGRARRRRCASRPCALRRRPPARAPRRTRVVTPRPPSPSRCQLGLGHLAVLEAEPADVVAPDRVRSESVARSRTRTDVRSRPSQPRLPSARRLGRRCRATDSRLRAEVIMASMLGAPRRRTKDQDAQRAVAEVSERLLEVGRADPAAVLERLGAAAAGSPPTRPPSAWSASAGTRRRTRRPRPGTGSS